jgi:hypothetical protein
MLADAKANITLENAGAQPHVGTSTAPVGGLVYRIATPVVITAKATLGAMSADNPCALAAIPTAQSLSAVVPDSNTQFLFSSNAGAFTTTNLTFGFSSGMLTDYSAQRPSEVNAVAGLPVRIINDIMTIPTQLVQARVNYDTQATALVNGNTAVKQAQIQQANTLTNAQAAVVNARTALMQAQIGQPAAIANAQAALIQAQQALQKAIAAAAATGPSASQP